MAPINGCDVRVEPTAHEGIGLTCQPCYGFKIFVVWEFDHDGNDPTPEDIAEAARAHRNGRPVTASRGLPPREDNDLRAAAQAVVTAIISSGSGPAAPCFDEHDRAVERQRGSWHVVDGDAIDKLRAALNG